VACVIQNKKPFSQGLVRQSQLYRFIELSKLSASSLHLLSDSATKLEGGGVLVPCISEAGGAIGLDATSRHFLAWLGKGREAEHAELMAAQMHISVEQLILRGIVEQFVDGQWRAGTKALHLIDRCVPNRQPVELLDLLSRMAIKHGIRHPETDPLLLAARVYFFGRRPISEHNFDHSGELRAAAKLEELIRRRLDRKQSWTVRLHKGYWYFQPLVSRRKNTSSHSIKLYISPAPGTLTEFASSIVRCLAESKAYAFKAGAGILGIQRPDKLVAYFDNYSDLEQSARSILMLLRGKEPHGVPFTCSIDESPIVSWGVDPPLEHSRAIQWQESESWRLWVCNRLASSILFGRAQNENPEHLERYCLARLDSEGVDILRWCPKRLFLEEYKT